MPFVRDENETILWEGRACVPMRMKAVTGLGLSLIFVGSLVAQLGLARGLALAVASILFVLPGLLYFTAKGSHYYVTNRRVVKEKFPVLQQLEFQEVGRVRFPIIRFGVLGLWAVYSYPKHPLLTYYVVFSYLDKGEAGKVKRIVDSVMQGIAPN